MLGSQCGHSMRSFNLMRVSSDIRFMRTFLTLLNICKFCSIVTPPLLQNIAILINNNTPKYQPVITFYKSGSVAMNKISLPKVQYHSYLSNFYFLSILMAFVIFFTPTPTRTFYFIYQTSPAY